MSTLSVSRLEDKSEATVTALLAHRTRAEAARHLGVTRRTLQRRLRDPRIREAYRAARQQLLERTLDRLAGSGDPAAGLVRDLLQQAGELLARSQDAEAPADLAARLLVLAERTLARDPERLRRHPDRLRALADLRHRLEAGGDLSPAAVLDVIEQVLVEK